MSCSRYALAAQGVLFENAYATASVTPVSHASILTGQNPYVHGRRVLHGLGDNRVGDAAVTLAEILKGAQYRTAAFISAFSAGSRFGLGQGSISSKSPLSSPSTRSSMSRERRRARLIDRQPCRCGSANRVHGWA